MCCIFTCCGWVIDLVQRFWVFAMSCCISGAVSCTLVTASMSGIAMGYNYSLAEYIDLKETNVSVYLKRGVFDDDIADDMEWRRSGGHLPVKGLINEDNLETGAPMDYASTSVPYGRRMDESIFESDDHHKFEGSLMKLTVKPLYGGSRTPNLYTTGSVNPNEEPREPALGPDELKEVQASINRRKYNFQKITTYKYDTPISTLQDYDERDFPRIGMAMIPNNSGRRQMLENMNGPGYGDSARMLVPDANIGDADKWADPKLPKDKLPPRDEKFILPEVATYPRPLTLRQGPLRPSRPPPPKTYPTHTTSPAARGEDEIAMFKKNMAQYKTKFDEEFRANQDRSEEEDDVVKKLKKKKGGDIGIGEEYDEEFKGLPVRRRRRNDLAIEKKTGLNKSETDFNYKVHNTLQSNLLTKLLNVTEEKKNIETVSLSQNDMESRNEIDWKDNVFHKIKDLLNNFSRIPLSKQPRKVSEILGLQTVADSYTMSAVF